MHLNMLQIVGGQTWPNFLPILGFKPSRVCFLTSHDADKRFERAISRMRDASVAAGVPFEIRILSTPGSEPTLEECRQTLRELDGEEIHLVNLTGGTKTMSVAALDYARARSIPSFHLDTRRSTQPFDDFKSAPMDFPLPDLAEIAKSMNVRLALMAQGFPVPESFKSPDEQHLAFAGQAAQIRIPLPAHECISKAVANLRNTLTDERGGFLRKGKLRAALANPIVAEENTPWCLYLQTAADCGIIGRLNDDRDFRLVTIDPGTTSGDELSSLAQKNFKLLEGIWFELAVLDHLRSDPSFSDVCWSVEADRSIDEAATSLGETDLVAFNHKTLNLHFISCKTQGPHATPLDHIQGLRRRATKEGGEFSKAELWIFHPKSKDQRQELEQHCREQKVTLRVFTDLPQP